MLVNIYAAPLPPHPDHSPNTFQIDPEEIIDFSFYIITPIITMKDKTRYWIFTPHSIEEASKESPIMKKLYDLYVEQLNNIDPELLLDNAYPQLEPKYKGPAPYDFLEP